MTIYSLHKGDLKSPIPYFGGKSNFAQRVWGQFGTVDRYIEPFAGSLAVLLYKKIPTGMEIVADTNGYVCNMHRAIIHAPDEVAKWAAYPSIHQDLTARQGYLWDWLQNNSDQLSEDAEYFDAKVAGWWIWGTSNWIGSNYAIPTKVDGSFRDTRVNMGNQGVQNEQEGLKRWKASYNCR